MELVRTALNNLFPSLLVSYRPETEGSSCNETDTGMDKENNNEAWAENST